MLIDTLLKIGEAYEDSFVQMLTRRLNPPRTSMELIIVRIIFDMDEETVRFEEKEYVSQLEEEYLWIGNNFIAAREPVARLTFSEAKYFPQVITEIIKRIGVSGNLTFLNNILLEINKKFLQGKVDLNERLEKWISARSEYKPVLYTICVYRHGKLIELAKESEYKEALKLLISPSGREIEGLCYLCGKEGLVLSDPSFEKGTLLKTYITDQPGFLSGVTRKDNLKALMSNFAICHSCRTKLIIGEKKVSKDFSTRIRDLPVLLLPRADFESAQSFRNNIEDVTLYFKQLIRGKKSGEEIIRKIESHMDNLGWYTITLIFGEASQASFLYYGMVQEVPLTRVQALSKLSEKIEGDAIKVLEGESTEWSLKLEDIADLIPLRKQGNKVDYGPLIEILTSLLHRLPISKATLLNHAKRLAWIYRYKSDSGYKVFPKPGSNDYVFVSKMLKFNYLIRLMKDDGILQKNDVITNIDLNEGLKTWVEQMGYDDKSTGLFLLGYLVGRIGNAQYNKGDKKKSVLDKIDFKGMRWEKIQTLTNQVLSGMRNYKILDSYNERIYHEAHRLLNRCRQSIDASSPSENLFYILTGYSYATYMAVRGGKNE